MNAAVSTVLAKPEVSDDDKELDGMPHIPRAVDSPLLIEALVREILKNGFGELTQTGFAEAPFAKEPACRSAPVLTEISQPIKDECGHKMATRWAQDGYKCG